MLVVGAEFSTASALPIMERSFIAHGVTNIETLVIEGSGHWLAEEQPESTVQAISTFATNVFRK